MGDVDDKLWYNRDIMLILGIESSCDETAAAVVKDGVEILSNVVVSQIDIFKEYGGVIPEVAARSDVCSSDLGEKSARGRGGNKRGD